MAVWQDTATGVTLRMFSSHAAPDESSLNDRQSWLLHKLAFGGEFLATELHQLALEEGFQVVPRTLRRDLENLVERRLVIMEARGRFSKYRQPG